MNSILRTIVRSGGFKSLVSQQIIGIRTVGARSLWHMSKPTITSNRCTGCGGYTCGCGKRFTSTSGEKALIDFLQDEIETEKTSLAGHLPTQLDGFQIKLDAAEVELTKSIAGEKIIIKFNVNHSVDAAENDDENLEFDNQQQAQQEPPKLLSKPNFEVDIVKNDMTLSLSCTFLGGVPRDGEYEDVYGIEELTIFKGAHSEKVYACAGDMLDGYFYDLLMNLLVEKGISDEFVNKISEFATQYEQNLFVNLLQDTKKFFESK